MGEASGFAYAGARMQSRYADRLAETTWSHFARVGDFAHLVQNVRATALAPWVADFGADTGPHRIEAGLRERYRREVDEVARWLPGPWRDAVAWFAWLPDLPSVAHVRYGRAARAWMAEDAIARELAELGRRDAPALPADLVAIARAPDDGRPVSAHWLDAWRRRWPRAPRARADALEDAYRQVGRLLGTRPGQERAERAAEPELRRLFRWHGRAPAGAFAYLGLLYLQFARLRGIMLRGLLFRSAA